MSDLESSVSNKRRKNSSSSSGSRSRSPIIRKERSFQRHRSPSPINRRKQFNFPKLSKPLMEFKHFINIQNYKVDEVKAKSLYEKRDDEFVQDNINQTWFIEQFNPIYINEFKEMQKEVQNKSAIQFLQRFKKGYYDNIDFSVDKEDLTQYSIKEHQQDQSVKVYEDYQLNYQINLQNQPFFSENNFENIIIIDKIDKNLSKIKLVNLLKDFQGYEEFTITDIQNIQRQAFAKFNSNSNAENALQMLQQNDFIKKENLDVLLFVDPKTQQVKVSNKQIIQRIQKEFDQIVEIVKLYIQKHSIQELDNFVNEVQNRQQMTLEQKYDLLILYLRRVHFYCYFTQIEYVSYHHIAYKGDLCFLRQKQIIQQDNDIPNWQTQLIQKNQQKINQLKQQDSYIPLEDQINEGFVQVLQKNKRQESSWACGVENCSKKFKGVNFLQKHYLNKHSEQYDKLKEEVINLLMKNNYKKRKDKQNIDNRKNSIQSSKPFSSEPYKKKQFVDLDKPQISQQKGPQDIDFDDL